MSDMTAFVPYEPLTLPPVVFTTTAIVEAEESSDTTREEYLAEVITELIGDWRRNKSDLSRYLYEMKTELAQRGRGGKWAGFLRSLDFSRTTADRWIEDYEIATGRKEKRTERCDFRPDLAQELVEMVVEAEDALTDASAEFIDEDPDPEEEKGEESGPENPNPNPTSGAGTKKPRSNRTVLKLSYPIEERKDLDEWLSALVRHAPLKTDKAQVIYHLVEQAYDTLKANAAAGVQE